VVERETGKFLGLVSKKDLLAIYSQEVLGRPAMLATFVSHGAGKDYVELPPDFALRLVPVPVPLLGRTLAELRLPQALGVRVIELKRQRAGAPAERVMPSADTVLRSGDALIVIGPNAGISRLEKGELQEAEALAQPAFE
jgi:Trk K+ transport system NAD-binding subunit